MFDNYPRVIAKKCDRATVGLIERRMVRFMRQRKVA